MRTTWLAILLVFSVVASGFILVRSRTADEAPDLAGLAEGAQAALESATARFGGEPEPEPEADAAEREPATFYRYTDETGTVRFVTSLAEVPKKFRDDAQPVGNRVQRAPALPASKRAAGRQVARQAAAAGIERSLDHEVVVYTTSWCGWCRKTLAFLDKQGVSYENRDIEADDDWRDELIEKTGGTTIPVVEIDGEIIRGYDPTRMAQLLRSS
jgi:glutaredoxin